MSRADALLEKAARRLDELSRRAAREDGPAANLAEPLAEDATLLRGMRPSLIAARFRGRKVDAPRPDPETDPEEHPAARAERPKKARSGGVTSLLAVAAAAFVAGVVVARILDWRGHAHPRL